MVEILVCYAVVALIAVGFFSLGRALGTRYPVAGSLLCAFALAIGWWTCWLAGGDLVWALWAPARIAYLCSYCPALLIVLAAGSLSVNQSVRVLNRRFLCGALCFAVGALFSGVMLRPQLRPIQLSHVNQWSEGVCLQSHESSCVPAAAANLLHLHGLEFGERRLAEFARTSRDGTPPLGSFLSISQAVEGTELKACIQLKQNKVSPQHLPMLAHVRFEESTSVVPSMSNLYSRLLQGIRARGQGHAVVIVERCEDGWIVADPASGRVVWSDEYLAASWSGEGVYLCRK